MRLFVNDEGNLGEWTSDNTDNAVNAGASILTSWFNSKNSGGSSSGSGGGLPNPNYYNPGGSNQPTTVFVPTNQPTQAGIGSTGAIAIGAGALAIVGVMIFAISQSKKN